MESSSNLQCPSCRKNDSVRVIFPRFNHLDYGHSFCSVCNISFDSNVNEILENYSELNENKITILQEAEYRKYFIETSDITDGSEDIYTSFEWESQTKLKDGIVGHIIEELSKKFTASDNFSVLDIGCGDGFTTALLSDTFPHATFVALDPSPQIQKLKGKESIRVYQGVVQDINFEEELFDAVLIFGNLMLHADPFDTLKIARSLLKDNGVLLFDFKNINSASRIIARTLGSVGIPALCKKNFIQRNFVNMRYGLSKGFMKRFCKGIDLKVTHTFSKPPRLLEFGNKSKYSRGFLGVLWRVTNYADRFRNEMAWVQFTCAKNSNN